MLQHIQLSLHVDPMYSREFSFHIDFSLFNGTFSVLFHKKIYCISTIGLVLVEMNGFEFIAQTFVCVCVFGLISGRFNSGTSVIIDETINPYSECSQK